jgi:RND family efflux transporter MFP subunit
VACGGRTDEKGGGSGGNGGQGGGKRPVAVQIVTAAPRTVAETREVTGTLTAAREARLLAQLEGAVTRVLVDEGDRVRAGQLLATFDNSVQAAELGAARTRARVARAAADRAARLLTLGAASRAEQEEAAAQVREAAGALRGAEARAAYGEIRSPFAGVVTAVRVNAGDVVGARQEAAVVADPADLRIEVPVSELDVVRLAPGDPVPVTVDALPGRAFTGRVSRIYPTVDPASRQGVVEVSLRRVPPVLRPGLLARLTLTVETVRDALAVPLDAVRRDVRDLPYVYVVQDVLVREPAGKGGEGKGGEGKGGDKAGGDEQGGSKRAPGGKAEGDTVTRRVQIVLRRPVRVGLRGGDNFVQLTDGVRRGERVVVSGDQELSDSSRVRILPEREPRAGGAPGDVAGGGGGGDGVAGRGAAGGSGGTGPGAAPGEGGPGGGAADGAVASGAAASGPTSGAASGGAGSPGTGAAAAGASAASSAAASGRGQGGVGVGGGAGAVGTGGGVRGATGGVGVGGATGGGLSGGASAPTGVPSSGGARTGGRAGTTGRGGTTGGGSGPGGSGGSAGGGTGTGTGGGRGGG